MENIKLDIKFYNEDLASSWDTFIYQEAYNGAFVTTRNFLAYHPQGKFLDRSLLIYKDDRLIAVIPACELKNDNGRILYSHRGSTFGGIIVAKEYFNVRYLKAIITVIDEYIAKEGYSSVVLRQVPTVFSAGSVGSLDYLLKLQGFAKFEELSFVVDISKIKDGDVLSIMRWNTKQQVVQSLKFNLSVRELNNKDEIQKFHQMLSENLKRHEVKPVHSAEEFWDLLRRFPERVKFYGCFKDNMLIGAALTWLYGDHLLHLQNICMDYNYQNLRPSNILVYYFIKKCLDDRLSYFSFGISTEDNGNQLNFNLAKFKEGFGADGYINSIYYKDYGI